jgi:hypothetical protein
MAFRRLAALVVAMFIPNGVRCWSAPPNSTPTVAAVKVPAPPTGYVPSNPLFGPTRNYIYKNSDGAFALQQGGGGGFANYRWPGDASLNNDSLTFMAYVNLTDTSGASIPVGTTVAAWLYEATDASGNKWYLAFGVNRLRPNVPHFGLYYSFFDPLATGGPYLMDRWLSIPGTSRQ